MERWRVEDLMELAEAGGLSSFVSPEHWLKLKTNSPRERLLQEAWTWKGLTLMDIRAAPSAA